MKHVHEIAPMIRNFSQASGLVSKAHAIDSVDSAAKKAALLARFSKELLAVTRTLAGVDGTAATWNTKSGSGLQYGWLKKFGIDKGHSFLMEKFVVGDFSEDDKRIILDPACSGKAMLNAVANHWIKCFSTGEALVSAKEGSSWVGFKTKPGVTARMESLIKGDAISRKTAASAATPEYDMFSGPDTVPADAPAPAAHNPMDVF